MVLPHLEPCPDTQLCSALWTKVGGQETATTASVQIVKSLCSVCFNLDGCLDCTLSAYALELQPQDQIR
jgi:hypothetical protein